MNSSRHLADDQLLLWAEGELPARMQRGAEEHLAECAICRGRMDELQCAEQEFGAAGRAVTPHLAARDEARRALGARIAEMKRENSSRGSLLRWPVRRPWRVGLALAGVAVVAALVFNRIGALPAKVGGQQASLLPEPDSRITPGAAAVVSQTQLCSEPEPPVMIPAALKSRVLQLYGVPQSDPQTYEVDYLITPQLGGATDVRNLWPEPYEHTLWNAHVKDQLEDRLRDLVCHGNLDLATAQHDISTDWIAAYRKYFHADAPVMVGSS